MKIFLALFVAFFLTACTTTTKQKTVHFDRNYKNALTAIQQGDFEKAYRNLETYYLLDDVIKKPTRLMVTMKIEIERLFKKHPEIITAGLNTFNAKSLYNSLKLRKGNKEKAKRLELIRIRAFKKISPENYSLAANLYTDFFGQTPEALTRVLIAENKARAKAKGKFTNYTAKGSLEVTKPLKCVDLETVTNKHSAADIFTGVEACIKANDVIRATRLYAFALAYGRYDQMRMVDKTARAAVRALQYKYVRPSKEFAAKMKVEIKKHSSANKGSEAFTTLCNTVNQIGKPDYHPRYMIKHGMSVFTGGESGIVKDFNEEESWNKIYTNFLQCS